MKRIGVSQIRGLNATRLRELMTDGELVEICGRDHTPFRILVRRGRSRGRH